MGKNLISYIVIFCLLFNSCVCGDTLSNTSALKRAEFRALIHKLAEDLRQDRLTPSEVIRIAEDRIAELSTYPEVEPYIRALRKIIKIAKKRLQPGQDRPKAVIASIRQFFAEEYQAGGKKSKTYENIIAPILEEYGLSIGLRILRLFGIISSDVKNNILKTVGKDKNLGLLRYIFLLGFRTIPILIGITSILLGIPPAMIAEELTFLALLSTILSMLSHNSIRSAFGALLVGTGIFYIFSIQALYSYLGIPLIILVPFLVHSTTWNQFIADIIINNIELKAMSSLMHNRDTSDAYFCEADNEEITPHIKRILEDPSEKDFGFIKGTSDEGKTGRLDVSKWQAMVQEALTKFDLNDYSIVILRGVSFSGHYGKNRNRIYIPVEILEIATPEILEDFIEHEYLHTKGKDEDYIRQNSETKRPGVYEEAKRLYRYYIVKRLAGAVQDSPLLKTKLEDILQRVQDGKSIRLTETQLHRLLWLIDRSKETDLVVEIAGLLNLIMEPGYKGDVGHVIMAIEKEILEVLTKNMEKEKFKELIKDSQMAKLVLHLFSQARTWKAKRKIRPINLRKWITEKRVSPTEIKDKDIIIVDTIDSTLIIYPANKNEIGIQLPNSDYRVYRIPRCIDIDKEWKLDAVFRHAESIKMAERIADELEKGEIKSKISFNPEVFFWVQNILKKKLGDKPERYALERRLLLSVLFQAYPDLDPGFKKQLEEFSPSCSDLGRWLDLVYADRFLLSSGIYKRPQLFEIIKQMAKKAEEIYTQMDESASRIFPGGEYGIEMNSSLHVYSSIVALARIISEFDIDKDFDKPERIAARLISYFVEGRKDVDLSELLRFLKEKLELRELDEALAQGGSLEDLRKGILGNILIEFFRRIPKADIHHHLDGCISPELAFKIIKKYPKLMELYGNPKSPEDLKPYIEFNYKGEGDINWDDLWEKFELFRDILNTSLDEVTTLFKESSLEDFYNDGLTLIEHKVSIITPGQDPEIDPAKVLEAAVRGLIEAEDETRGRLRTGLIPCIWKTPQHILGSRYEELAKMEKTDPGIIIREAREEALRQVKLVVDLKKTWEREKPEYAPYLIGIDTVGDEKDYIREVTAPALSYAAENGLSITEHLGENWNPGELKQALLRIRQGIESGIIKRIGHATALGIETEDGEIRRMQEEIKELIRRKGIHIESCYSSNKLLAPERAIPRYKDHPAVRFYRELGNVSINTDDSWILHTRGLSGEFMKVWLANPELKYSDIQRIIENAFKATFIDRRAKDLKRLRELIHDIMNCWGMISNGVIAILKRQGVEDAEFRGLYKRAHGIFNEYHDTKAGFGPRKAVDDLIGKIETLRQAGNWILGKIGYLKNLAPKENELISAIETQTQQFLKLLDELGTGAEEEAQTDIIKVIRDLSIINPDITLKLDIPKDLPSVLIPSSEISTLRVFWNLLSNSITTGCRNIKITVDMTGNSLNIAVEDDGAGIPDELLRIPEGADRPWIFLAGHTTKTREPGEHGLGLSYVWDTVVGKWGARINIESTVGKGTKFILVIPISPRELIKKGLDELLEIVPTADHEILAHRIFDLLRYSFVASKDPQVFQEWLEGSILAGIARRYADTLAKNGAAWLGTRGVVKDIVGVTEKLKGELGETEREKLIDKLTEDFKEVFYTPLDQYRYADESGPDIRQLGEKYPALKRKVVEFNNWLREQGEIMQVRLNLDHQGTYLDLANAIEQKILFGSDPHIMYDLHDDNGPMGTEMTEANWVGYARAARLLPWVAHIRPVEPGTTVVRIPEVSGIASVSVCFDYFSYYGLPDLKKTIQKDDDAFRLTDADIENMVNQIIDGLMLDNLDIRLFSMAISPAYIWPDQAEIIVDRLIEGIKSYVTRRKETDWYKKRLGELIPSPLLVDDPDVSKFIDDALSTKGPEEIEQLDDNELCHRLYYALEYPGIGLPGRPAPIEGWWKHIVTTLKIPAEYDGIVKGLTDIRLRYQYITNLLQEWLRRKRNNYLPPARPLGDIDPVETELELRRSS